MGMIGGSSDGGSSGLQATEREPERSSGFSRGSFIYAAPVRLAPQETRTFPVTAVAVERRRIFEVAAAAELLERTILDYREQRRFLLHAFVIMPDHFHALITPAPDVSLEKAVQYIKGGFSFRLKSKRDVWMRSFNESQTLTVEKFVSCKRYIEENPVRRGLLSAADAYPYSSAGRSGLDRMPAHFHS
jgi:putative transposase